MGGIWIFGGTSEGRRLAGFCAGNGILAAVSVATEYGEQALYRKQEPDPTSDGSWQGKVMQGRMNELQMREYLKTGDVDLVVDATHPYAVEVTENIRRACAAESVEYVRLLRKGTGDVGTDGVIAVDTAAEAADYLSGTEGNIMLTTGSKELPVFCEALEVQRLYPRVLPSVESLEICERNQIPLANCIAMQGPFSEAVNLGLLMQYRCRFLVTKESGSAGGFEEKITACRKAGVTAVVIRRPVVEDGLDFSEVCGYLAGKYEIPLCREPEEKTGQIAVDIVGIGMGTDETMTEEVRQVIAKADILIGGKRMLKPYEDSDKVLFGCYQAEAIRRYLDRLAGTGTDNPDGESCVCTVCTAKRVAVLVSGDVGFYSGAGKLVDALNGYPVRLYPGISSVVYMASRIGTPWQDMTLCSVHGRNQNILAKIRKHEKVFTLAGKCEEVHHVCRQLIRYGMNQVEVCVGENLSYGNERIWRGSPEACLEEAFGNLLVAVFLHKEYQNPSLGFGIPDEAFIRGKVPMTKEEVRTISLSKLRLTKDAVVYDIGAGTGSVSIEAALAAEDGMVYAIEKKAEAAELVEKNAERFGVANLTVIRGMAPGIFDGLPAPTHAFIGGSSGNLKEIVGELKRRNPQVRIVVNAISLETIAEMTELSKQYEMELATVTVAKASPVGNYQLMTGQNPVMIGTIRGR